MQDHIREKGGKDSTLGDTHSCVDKFFLLIAIFDVAGFDEFSIQVVELSLCEVFLQEGLQDMMVNHIKEAFYVSLDDSGDSASESDLAEGSVASTKGAEPMGGVVKFWFQDSFHYHIHGLLYDFIPRRSYS